MHLRLIAEINRPILFGSIGTGIALATVGALIQIIIASSSDLHTCMHPKEGHAFFIAICINISIKD